MPAPPKLPASNASVSASSSINAPRATFDNVSSPVHEAQHAGVDDMMRFNCSGANEAREHPTPTQLSPGRQAFPQKRGRTPDVPIR